MNILNLINLESIIPNSIGAILLTLLGDATMILGMRIYKIELKTKLILHIINIYEEIGAMFWHDWTIKTRKYLICVSFQV